MKFVCVGSFGMVGSVEELAIEGEQMANSPVGETIPGANQPPGAALLLHEPAGHRDLAVRPGGVRSRLGDDVRGGAIQPLRVERSPPLPRGPRCRRESILPGQQLLVHHWHSDATGQRSEP